mmetsp:Transcript_9473/g.25412  ORF Transcript_9473/g.25412 Transcript_9473/m.25412 type:complete len:375 (+) Transcript_9473:3-1127(+)
MKAEQAKLDEERKQHEEAQRRVLEEERKAMELERQKMEEERKAFQQEKEAQVTAIAEEKQRRSSIMMQASPQKAGAATLAEECALGRSPGTQMAQQAAEQAQEMIQERVQKLELEFQQKHQEIQEAMRLLQERNADLERQLNPRDVAGTLAGTPTKDRGESDVPPSPISLDEHPATPDTGRATQDRLDRSGTRSGKRYSLLSLDNDTRGLSTNSKAKRHSVAHDALSAYGKAMPCQDSADRKRIGEAAGTSSGDLGSQRRWWAQQRTFLLEDLYPNGSPSAGGRTATLGNGGGGTPGRRQTKGGESRERRATLSTAPEEPSLPHARNLSTTFETAEDLPGSASSKSEKADSKLKAPKFYYSKRFSVGGVPEGGQ